MGSSDLKACWLQTWEGSIFQFTSEAMVDAMLFDVDSSFMSIEVISRLEVARHTEGSHSPDSNVYLMSLTDTLGGTFSKCLVPQPNTKLTFT